MLLLLLLLLLLLWLAAAAAATVSLSFVVAPLSWKRGDDGTEPVASQSLAAGTEVTRSILIASSSSVCFWSPLARSLGRSIEAR